MLEEEKRIANDMRRRDNLIARAAAVGLKVLCDPMACDTVVLTLGEFAELVVRLESQPQP